jgi:phenylpyruvate tautomerase PptA (4-oxalocrotonate tautomerase family)
MPLMDIIHPQGSFSPAAREELLSTLWALCLRWEGVPETEASAAIAWVYLDERPRASVSVGGRPLTQNVYRVHVRVMAGFLDQERTDGMVREVTDAIVRADGRDGDGSGPRVYVIVQEVPSGTWGVDGVVWHSVATATAMGAEPARVEAMAQAIAANPRPLVPLAGART